VPLAHARLREVPLAFVQLREPDAVTEEQIIAYCAERLASFKVPRHVLFVPAFQMTDSGKIQKRPLVEQAQVAMGARV
jgi:acyl-CoA synthetase (AMP-forming)/AMP-acid ligase II